MIRKIIIAVFVLFAVTSPLAVMANNVPVTQKQSSSQQRPQVTAPVTKKQVPQRLLTFLLILKALGIHTHAA